MRGEIVGRAAGWRRNQRPVTDQFPDPHLVVHHDTDFGRLPRLAQQRYFVESERLHDFVFRCALSCAADAIARFRCKQTIFQSLFAKFVHQKPDRSEIHPVDRLAQIAGTHAAFAA